MLCQTTKVSKISTGIFLGDSVFAVEFALNDRADSAREGILLETSLQMPSEPLRVSGE